MIVEAERTPYYLGWQRGVKPLPDMKIWEWANENVELPSSTSAEPGRYDIDRTPFNKEIFEVLGPDSPIADVYYMKPTQVGATTVGTIFLGFSIAIDPCPFMYILPTCDLVKKFSKQRVDPLLETTPGLKELVGEKRSRDSNNNLTEKIFPGGVAVFVGANSGPGLRFMSARKQVYDEEDAYPQDVGGEGDPVEVAKKRTDAFPNNSKRFHISTPLIRDESRIEEGYENSDQRKYFVPCPDCGFLQVLVWAQLSFDKDDLTKPAMYICIDCGVLIDQRFKLKMLEKGEWAAQKPGEGKAAGFHINGLYSPWKSWDEGVKEFVVATKRKDLKKLKTWTNTYLAETWEEQGETVDEQTLVDRCEKFGPELPNRILVVTAGVDVQKNRIEVQITGWAREFESWALDHVVIPGNPTQKSTWDDLDNHLKRTFIRKDGVSLRIASTFVDSGNWSTEVYKFTKPRELRRVYSCKGASTPGKPITGKPSTNNNAGAILYSVGTEQAKEQIYSGLKNERVGSGYIHFPLQFPTNPDGPNEDYFQSMTAEKLVRRKGKNVWVKRSDRARNEVLDCWVYALAAMENLKIAWGQLEDNLNSQVVDESKKEKEVSQPVARRRKSFVKNWGFLNGNS